MSLAHCRTGSSRFAMVVRRDRGQALSLLRYYKHRAPGGRSGTPTRPSIRRRCGSPFRKGNGSGATRLWLDLSANREYRNVSERLPEESIDRRNQQQPRPHRQGRETCRVSRSFHGFISKPTARVDGIPSTPARLPDRSTGSPTRSDRLGDRRAPPNRRRSEYSATARYGVTHCPDRTS